MRGIRLITLAICGLLAPAPLTAGDFKDTLTVRGDTLELAGEGALSRWMIKGCDMALYVPEGTKPGRLLDAETPRALEFIYARGIKSEQFASTAWKTLRQNWNKEELAEAKSDIDDLHELFQDVGKGDRYRLVYRPGEGVELLLNNESLGAAGDSELAEVYFSIWLGKEPLDVGLKRKLVSGLK